MIPRIITQIWIGEKPLPEREAGWCLDMKRMNPKWEHRLLGNDLLERYKEDPYVRHMLLRKSPLAFVADRLRMLVLHDDGGIYLDTDCLPRRPLDALPMWDEPTVEFVYGMRDPYREGVALHRSVAFCDNTVLASSPGSAMCKKVLSLWRPEEIEITGHRVGLCILSNADWTCRGLGHRYFYSMRSHPESIVDHDSHNAGSWVADKTPIPTVRKRRDHHTHAQMSTALDHFSNVTRDYCRLEKLDGRQAIVFDMEIHDDPTQEEFAEIHARISPLIRRALREQYCFWQGHEVVDPISKPTFKKE